MLLRPTFRPPDRCHDMPRLKALHNEELAKAYGREVEHQVCIRTAMNRNGLGVKAPFDYGVLAVLSIAQGQRGLMAFFRLTQYTFRAFRYRHSHRQCTDELVH